MGRLTRSAECPACTSSLLHTFFELRDMPVFVNFLWASHDAARTSQRGDIELAICSDCGLIYNTAFEVERLQYHAAYENSLHYSGVFQAYADDLADDLAQRYCLRDKVVVEIGCGRGDFLAALVRRGALRGIGFDPSHRDAPADAPLDRMEFVLDYYGERYSSVVADFVCSRHTLEHVSNPHEMLGPLRRTIGDRETTVFFEVPNVRYTIANAFIWDIIYEHVLYFSSGSITRLFQTAGFEVLRVYETFGGQYLCLEAKVAAAGRQGAPPEPQPLNDMIEGFRLSHQRYVRSWKERLASFAARGMRVVLWGAGSKGVTFLNLLDGVGRVDAVVDVNPHKQGMFIAGTGHEILAPDALPALQPDVVIVANPLYRDEIARTNASMGLSPEYVQL